MQVQSLGQGDPLEDEMATHSTILAWKIPWTEEPGVLQSVGSPRVRHSWAQWWAREHSVEGNLYFFLVKSMRPTQRGWLSSWTWKRRFYWGGRAIWVTFAGRFWWTLLDILNIVLALKDLNLWERENMRLFQKLRLTDSNESKKSKTSIFLI